MFRGSMVALITPMREGKVDVDALQKLVDYHIDAGTNAIVAAGTTGESGTLSCDEKLLVIKEIIDQANERIPVIAGTAMNATRDCIDLTQKAMECGADAALIMTPAYIKPTQEGLFQHYNAIARAVPVPVILYNVPGRTACDLLPETVARLAESSNIIGIKEASGQMTRLQDILDLSDGCIDVYSGDDLTAAQWMQAGAKGVISVTANVAAREMANLCDLALDNKFADCLRINEKLQRLHELLFIEPNPIPVKWAAYKMGMADDELRLPLTVLSVEHRQELEKTLQTLHLI